MQNFGNYEFVYDIVDPLGATNSRSETGDATGRKQGSYTLTDIDGRARRVQYVADKQGFRASVDTNEPGTALSAPANVIINSPYPPPSAPVVVSFPLSVDGTPVIPTAVKGIAVPAASKAPAAPITPDVVAITPPGAIAPTSDTHPINPWVAVPEPESLLAPVSVPGTAFSTTTRHETRGPVFPDQIAPAVAPSSPISPVPGAASVVPERSSSVKTTSFGNTIRHETPIFPQAPIPPAVANPARISPVGATSPVGSFSRSSSKTSFSNIIRHEAPISGQVPAAPSPVAPARISPAGNIPVRSAPRASVKTTFSNRIIHQVPSSLPTSVSKFSGPPAEIVSSTATNPGSRFAVASGKTTSFSSNIRHEAPISVPARMPVSLPKQTVIPIVAVPASVTSARKVINHEAPFFPPSQFTSISEITTQKGMSSPPAPVAPIIAGPSSVNAKFVSPTANYPAIFSPASITSFSSAITGISPALVSPVSPIFAFPASESSYSTVLRHGAAPVVSTPVTSYSNVLARAAAITDASSVTSILTAPPPITSYGNIAGQRAAVGISAYGFGVYGKGVSNSMMLK